MALFCQNMLEIAVELAMTDPDYGDMALKFVEHFLWIASSMAHLGEDTGMWDEEDGFFYDVLRLPDGQAAAAQGPVDGRPAAPLRRHDLRGGAAGEVPRARRAVRAGSSTLGPSSAPRSTTRRKPGVAGRRLASILDETKLRRVLAKMLDENEFLSPFGLRSLSRYHADHPYVIHAGGQEYRVVLPAGRVRHRHVRRQLELARPDLDAGQRPDHPGPAAVLPLLRRRLHRRMPHRLRPADEPVPGGRGDRAPAVRASFLQGRRTAAARSSAATEKFQDDPHWRDCLLFYEYFHGDNGAGLGASHQTGWTGVIARLMHLFATLTPEQAMEGGKKSYFAACSRAEVVGSSAGR